MTKLRLAMGIVAAACALSARASAQTLPAMKARVQHNGVECALAGDSATELDYTYTASGVGLGSWSSSFQLHVVCPLTWATGDSTTAPGVFYSVVIYVVDPGNTWLPYCDFHSVKSTGEDSTPLPNSSFTWDSTKSRWTWVDPSPFLKGLQLFGSDIQYLDCYMPPGGGIIGAVTVQEVGPPDTGVPKAPVLNPSASSARW